jgi:hypothetical protein
VAVEPGQQAQLLVETGATRHLRTPLPETGLMQGAEAEAVPAVGLLRLGPEQPEVPVVVARGQPVLADRAQLVKETLVTREILMEPIILVVAAVAQQLLVLLLPLLLLVMGVQDTHLPFQVHL